MARVVSLGIHIVDVLGRPVSAIPPGQDLAILDEIRITVAGTAAGTSVDLAKLGMEVYAVGAIGSDELGNFLLTTMERYGINTTGLVKKSGVQTSATMLPIRPNGERPALHVPGANAELVLSDIDMDLIASADYLHVGGTPLLTKLDGKPLREVFRNARDHGVVTTYDLLAMPVPDLAAKVKAVLPYVDYFMPGLDEAQMLSGLSERDEVCRFFLDEGAGTVVFKMGGEGSLLARYENGSLQVTRVPATQVKVVDSTGCGDSYCAGFIAGLARGWSEKDAARLGAACGALVIQGLGSDAGIVDFDETVKYMESADWIMDEEPKG